MKWTNNIVTRFHCMAVCVTNRSIRCEHFVLFNLLTKTTEMKSELTKKLACDSVSFLIWISCWEWIHMGLGHSMVKVVGLVCVWIISYELSDSSKRFIKRWATMRRIDCWYLGMRGYYKRIRTDWRSSLFESNSIGEFAHVSLVLPILRSFPIADRHYSVQWKKMN